MKASCPFRGNSCTVFKNFRRMKASCPFSYPSHSSSSSPEILLFTMRFSTLLTSAVNAFWNYFHREWKIKDVMNSRGRPFVRRNLKKVYLTLAFALSSSAFGSYLSCSGNIGSLCVIVGASITMIRFSFVPPWRERQRVCLLIAGSFFLGASTDPSFIDPCCLVSRLLGMSMGFACFWTASRWTQSFHLLCFQGMALSIFGIPMGLLAGSAVSGCYIPSWTFLDLYVATLYFMLYVIAYSHELVINIRRGDTNYVKHSVTLFTDAPAVLIHFIRRAWIESLWRMLWLSPTSLH